MFSYYGYCGNLNFWWGNLGQTWVGTTEQPSGANYKIAYSSRAIIVNGNGF